MFIRVPDDDPAPPTPISDAPSAAARDAGPDRSGRSGHLRSVEPDRYTDWEAIYLDNVERLYRIIYGRVGNRADAEDLTAEVFRTALGPLRTSASIGEVRAYLLATARTVLATHWKRRFQMEITTIDVERDVVLLDEPPVESDAPQRVNRIIAALPENYRQILELRFLQACSLREAARTMNVSLANAKVLQHRALRRAAQISEELV
jgi:RNA polymerase sigma-70 factor (ECF subfamily)